MPTLAFVRRAFLNLADGESCSFPSTDSATRTYLQVAAAKERLFGNEDNNSTPLYTRTRSNSGQGRGGGGSGGAPTKTYTPTLGPVTLSLGGNGIDDRGAVAAATTIDGGASEGALLPHLALEVGGRATKSPSSAASSSGEFDPMGLFDGTTGADLKEKQEWFKEPPLPSAVLSSFSPVSPEPLPGPKIPLLSQSSLGEKSPLRPQADTSNGASPRKRNDSSSAAAKGTSPRPASAFEIA